MWSDQVSNPGPLTYESGSLPTALRGLANGSGRCKMANSGEPDQTAPSGANCHSNPNKPNGGVAFYDRRRYFDKPATAKITLIYKQFLCERK